MRANQMVLTDIDCPDCGRKMGIRTATTGVFLGCSGYALPPKERCKKTINLVSADEFVSATDGEEAETEALRAKHRCGVCGTAMDAYIIDDSRKLHVCGRNPDCDGYEIEKASSSSRATKGRASSVTAAAPRCSSRTASASTWVAPTTPARTPARS